MKRLLTLAATGMFATGLAVLPVTVFAQPSATVGTDAKPTTSTHTVTNDAKVAPGNKDAGATKDSAKTTGTKLRYRSDRRRGEANGQPRQGCLSGNSPQGAAPSRAAPHAFKQASPDRSNAPVVALFRSLGVRLQRCAGADQISIAIDVVHPLDRRPVFCGSHPWQRKRRLLS